MAFTFKHGDRPLPEYEIRRGVGRGGFGEVYYAVSDGGREVALKYLHTNVEIELRGASHCMNLKSPHLVTIFDIVKNASGDAFIIMEYISGPSLRDLMIAEDQGLGVAKATFLLKEIAKGLTHLHASGVVHRDLKPGNIFYDEGYVKIGDYGLSKILTQSASGGNTASVGTVAYMAPEVGSGNYSRSIDIYALGVMLYEMLVGRVPFEGQSTGEVLMKHLVNQPEVDALPAPFAQVIRKALAKDPRDRYATVDEMVDAVLGRPNIQQSLAGFDTMSLTQVAARTAGTRDDRSGPLEETLSYAAPAGASGNQLPVAEPASACRRSAPRLDELSPEFGGVHFAGFWIRFLAVFIDALVLSPFISGLPATYPVKLAYAVLLLAYWDGATVGKKVCGIRVVDAHGNPLDLGRAFVREIAKILSWMTGGVGFLLAGFTRYNQALHDMVGSTFVVHADSELPLKSVRPRRNEAGVRGPRRAGREEILTREDRAKARDQMNV